MIRHIMKDGTEVADITGYVIKAEKFDVLYKIIDGINERVNHEALRTSETRLESSTRS